MDDTNQRSNMKDMPAEFYLPPPTNAGLWQETWKLCLGSAAYIVILGIIVAATQGIAVSL